MNLTEPIKTAIFSYQKDADKLFDIRKHLRLPEQKGVLKIWDETEILPGANRANAIQGNLEAAEFIVLLVSSDFLDSDFYKNEISKTLERHESGLCKVVLVIINSCVWQMDERLTRLDVLPKNGKAIFSEHWANKEDILAQVANDLSRVALNFKGIESNFALAATQKSRLDDIFQKFATASHLLKNWKNDFSKIPDSHIKRSETTQIIDWVKSPLAEKQKGIALLVGDAGVGKSVILRDVLVGLEAENIPILGIKADQYCETSLRDLEKNLDLEEGIEAMVRTALDSSQRVVVLIDQIDALSQVLSARHEFLRTFLGLVQKLSSIPDLRVVISCRTFDLLHDNNFHFYQQQKTFQVGKLSEQEVKNTLQKHPAGEPNLSPRLLELLRTPLHLDVFCQIFRADLEFEKISLLRDLYEELWKQKVIKIQSPSENKIDSERCQKLLFKLSKAMANDTRLAVEARLFDAEFGTEIDYLRSAGILQKSDDGGKLTFFHQTFYEFAFAKQFVSDPKSSIEKYLVDEEQHLRIRACVKMMVEFLRDDYLRDPSRVEYLRVLEAILPSDGFYFHIKLLLLSLLGYVKEPLEVEKSLVRRLVLPDEKLFKAFVGVVNSREWLLFLLKEGKLKPLFLPESSPSERHSLLNLFSRHLPESRAEILKFVWDAPDEMNEKTHFASMILHHLKIWDNPLATQLFDKYVSQQDSFFYWEYIKQAAAHQFKWAFAHLQKGIENEIEKRRSDYHETELEHEVDTTITYFTDHHPAESFDLLLKIQLDNFCRKTNREKPTPIEWDNIGYFLDFDYKRHGTTTIFSLLIRSVRNLAKAKSPRFSAFAAENLDSNSATRLLILVEGFRANLEAFAIETAQFFKIFMEKNGFEASDTLTWRVRQLLGEAYPFFSEEEKLWVLRQVAKIKCEREKQAVADGSESAKWVGYLRLTWLKYLPENDFEKIVGLPEEFEDLKNRFPKWKDREPNRVKVTRIVAPLEPNKYETMSPDEWEASFKEFDKEYQHSFESNRGGLTEHAQQFKEEVKKRPEFFYPLLEDLLTNQEVPSDYLMQGLTGLSEAEAKLERSQFLLSLFKKVDFSGWEEWQVRQLVSLCGHFLNLKMDDDFIVEFLLKMAIHHADPSDDSLKVRVNDDEQASIFNSGFNTVRGAAAHLLTFCFRFKKYENLIFETLETVADRDLLMVRCQMMPELANLTLLNEARTLQLFLKLTAASEPLMMEHSPRSAQHFAWANFEALRPYFENALAHPKIYESMGIVLAQIWMDERGDALPLLERFFEKSDVAKNGAIDAAVHHITDAAGRVKNRGLELFSRFLDDPSDEVARAYDFAFHRLKVADFPHIQPLLGRLPQRKDPHAFYQYLNKCASEFPEGCIEVVKRLVDFGASDLPHASFFDKELLNVVVNAINGLRGVEAKNALLLFDKMLQDDRFGPSAEAVLEKN